MESWKVPAGGSWKNSFSKQYFPHQSLILGKAPSFWPAFRSHNCDKAGMWFKRLNILGLPCQPLFGWSLPVWPSFLPCHWWTRWARRSVQTDEAWSSFYVSAHGPLNYASFHLYKLGQERTWRTDSLPLNAQVGRKVNVPKYNLWSDFNRRKEKANNGLAWTLPYNTGEKEGKKVITQKELFMVFFECSGMSWKRNRKTANQKKEVAADPCLDSGMNKQPDDGKCQAIFTNFYEAVNVKKGLSHKHRRGNEMQHLLCRFWLTIIWGESWLLLADTFTFCGNLNLIKSY